MADVYTDTSASVYANLLAAGYDRFLEYQLRSQPVFRQMVDKHPVSVTNPGPTVTMNIIQQFATPAITPLSETLDVAATAPPAPTQVTVTVNEYGRSNVPTLRLKSLSYTTPDAALAHILGLDMVDSLDALVQAVLNAATHYIGKNATVVKTETSGFAEGSVAHGDSFDSGLARAAVSLLRRRNAPTRDVRGNYVALAHPDVINDVLADTGWLAPHQYTDTSNIYNAEVGTYLGARYISSPRATIVNDGSASEPVYRTYITGAQALVEATISDVHTVIGPQTDHLRRFFPMGWYYFGGWGIFRQESIEIVRSSSSISAL
jgi:N4-gp56 family major capsid protein